MILKIIIVSLIFLSAGYTQAEEFTVGQKDKDFSVSSLSIAVGDKVYFKNEDNFFHNVFSLSDAKFFDLGAYPQGDSREVVFDTPGTIKVECAIHPSMLMTIEVK